MKYLLSVCVLFGLTAPALALPEAELEAWQDDIAMYAQEIEARHIDVFHTLPEEDFQAAIASLLSALPDLTEDEIIARLMHLHHSLGDGHTAIPLWNYGYHRYPVEFKIVDGEVFLAAVGPDQADVLGLVVTAVDGRPVADVMDRMTAYAPFVENAGSQAVRVARYMSVAELMFALDLADRPDAVTLTLGSGETEIEIAVTAVAGETYNASLSHRLDYRQAFTEEQVSASTDGLSFVYLADVELGYIRFDYYPSAQNMDQFASEVVERMRQENGRHLAIDFRDNYGGDFYTGLRLAHQLNLLDGVDWQDGVYVLTSGVTFSAAMSNSAQFSDILNAQRVGEPTGATPCGYQDMGQFNLPNSGLLITYSKRDFCFAEPVAKALQPDHLVSVTIEHWRDGHDAALEWVLSDISDRQ